MLPLQETVTPHLASDVGNTTIGDVQQPHPSISPSPYWENIKSNPVVVPIVETKGVPGAGGAEGVPSRSSVGQHGGVLLPPT